jgi:VanZ family protein
LFRELNPQHQSGDFKLQIMRRSRQIVSDKDIPVLHDRNMNFHVALRWLAVALWMGVIFVVSSIPSLASPLESFYDFIARKLAHMAEYGVLTVLLFRAVRIHTRRNARALLIAAVVAVLYALSDEWHQTFVPGREGSLRDVAVDALGVVGMSLWLIRSK